MNQWLSKLNISYAMGSLNADIYQIADVYQILVAIKTELRLKLSSH